MRRSLLRNASLYARNLLHNFSSAAPLAVSTHSRLRLFSSGEKPKDPVALDTDDVDNKELKARIEKYFKGDEQVLPPIMEAILQRKLSGKHDDTDDELMNELEMQPIDDVDDKVFESDFEEFHETDDEIEDLYNAREIVMNRVVQDEYFNMDEKKWNDIVEDAMKHCFLRYRICSAGINSSLMT